MAKKKCGGKCATKKQEQLETEPCISEDIDIPEQVEDNLPVSEDIVEETVEEIVEERQEEFVSSLIEPAEQETQEDDTGSVEYKNNRDATEASSVKIENDFNRQGIRVGGPGIRKSRGAVKKARSLEDVNERVGIYKIWNDKPIRNIGEGTSTSDIPQRKNK